MSAKDYRHVTKDPKIDLIRTRIQDRYNLKDGKIPGKVLKQLSLDAGPGIGTYRGWFFGGTRRPQGLTLRFTLEALGCREAVIDLATGKELKPRK